MTGTWRVFRSESLRLRRSRAVLVGCLALLLVAALRVSLGALAEETERRSAEQRAAAAGREAPEESGANAYGPLADGWGAGLKLGSLLLLVLASRSLAGDREQGLLRLATTRSVSRGGLVWGRALVGVPACLVVLGLTGLGAWLAARGLYTFGPLLEFGYPLMSQEELDAEVWRAATATLPPLLGVWALGLLVSSLVGSPTAAVSVAVAGFVGFDLFKDLLGEGQRWVFLSFAPSFADSSAMGELSGVARGLSDAGFSDGVHRMNLVLPGPEALLLVVVAALLVRRKTL